MRIHVVAVALALLIVAVACEPKLHLTPDECAEDDNVCDGNVANRCEPGTGTDTSRVSESEDCGDDRTCMLQAISDGHNGTKPRAFCARKGPVPCGPSGETACNGDRYASECVSDYHGGQLVWRDVKCADNEVCRTGTCVSR